MHVAILRNSGDVRVEDGDRRTLLQVHRPDTIAARVEDTRAVWPHTARGIVLVLSCALPLAT